MARTPSIWLALLVASAPAITGATSWPIAFSYSPDSMPIVEARLAPPRKSLPEVDASIGKLDAERSHMESAQMLEVEAAYKKSVAAAAEKLPALIDSMMHVFENPAALLSLPRHAATSFNEIRKPGGQELSVRINVLPMTRPDSSLEARIDEVDSALARQEGNIFRQAAAEMEGLTKIVENEVQAQITSQIKNVLNAGAASAGFAAKAAAFLAVRQPVTASGAQLTTNVRVMASDAPFPTIAGMVEDLERRRDASKTKVRSKIFELQLKLLQAENKIVADRLESWVSQVLRSKR